MLETKLKSGIRETTTIQDGMVIDWDLPIKMDDGIVLRADVFRPIAPGRYPVIASSAPMRNGSRSRTATPRPGKS